MKLTMRENDKNGCLITFCGLDGSGKTSMIRMLAERLKQMDIEPYLTKQPTNAVRNSEIFRNYMDEEQHMEFDYRALSLMAASDRIQHTNKRIVPMLEQGKVVISDRYFYSCLANLRARGYTEDRWIYEIGQTIIRPTLSFFMDVPVEQAISRVRQRPEERERYIDIELQHRLREEYLSIAEDVGGIVISTEDSQEECFTKIWKLVDETCGFSENLKIETNLLNVTEIIIKLIKNNTVWDGDIRGDMDIDRDLGMDSLKRTQLVCDIEETFGFEFCVQDLEPDKFRYVGDICGMVGGYVG